MGGGGGGGGLVGVGIMMFWVEKNRKLTIGGGGATIIRDSRIYCNYLGIVTMLATYILTLY